MGKISELLKKFGIAFYQVDRLSLDNYFYEPFQDSEQSFEDNVVFETDSRITKKSLDELDFSLFRYFLDGSRKVYKIGDMITSDNKFVPVVAGQVGTACCRRDDDGRIRIYDIRHRNILMLHESIPDDEFILIQDSIKKYVSVKVPVIIDRFTFNRKEQDNPTNAAVAKIQKTMQDMEINLLKEMVKQKNLLSPDNMLVIDGSLQFLTQSFEPDIFYNVVGISKSYNPNLTSILRGRIHIGTLLAQLRFGERTPVYKYETRGTKKNAIGAWYLRIREPKNIRSPLEGVVKIEKMAMQEDVELGRLDTSIVDTISSCVLAERNPTCFGNDERWANHLYPVYLTEKALKHSFMSDIQFMNMF